MLHRQGSGYSIFMPDQPSLLLIDAMALAYRAFHAIPPLNAKDGTPTNALMGFIKAQRHLQERFKPTHLAVVFDGGLPETRMALLPTYKAQRAEMPEALSQQLPLLDAYLDAAAIARIRVKGQEADDVMATLARRAEASGMTVVMASNDKDLFQLVNERVIMVAPVKDAPVMDAAAILEKTGVGPEHIPAWLALTGDAVDNIPGVPGVGPKTAARLLAQFGSLDGLWSGLRSVTGDKLRAALEIARADVTRNLAMVTLDVNLQAIPELHELKCGSVHTAELRALLIRLDMPTLAPAAVVPTQLELL